MDLYYELLAKPVFGIRYVEQFYGNESTARTALGRLVAKGQVLKIRQNMYTCSSGRDGSPIASRFQIASAITDSSFISHHSAMEYYGVTDQVFYDVYVGSTRRFREFEFDGYYYRCVLSAFSAGVERPEYGGGIAVSDRERTVVDSIKDLDHIIGLEEVLSNVADMKMLNEEKLIQYLHLYENQFLYQKCGFILKQNQNLHGLSDHFFDICNAHIGKSKRYLTTDLSEAVVYDSNWQLVVPENIYRLKNGVG